jgi:hypothetical protein
MLCAPTTVVYLPENGCNQALTLDRLHVTKPPSWEGVVVTITII